MNTEKHGGKCKSAQVSPFSSRFLEEITAGFAHEINTPTQYLRDNLLFLQEAFAEMLNALSPRGQEPAAADSLKQDTEDEKPMALDLDYLRREVADAVSQSLEGTARIDTVAKAMADAFAVGTTQTTDIHKAIDTAVEATRHFWKYTAHLTKQFSADLPFVECEPEHTRQILLLLLYQASCVAEALYTGSGAAVPLRLTTVSEEGTRTAVDVRVGSAQEKDVDTFGPTRKASDIAARKPEWMQLQELIEIVPGARLYVREQQGQGAWYRLDLSAKPV